jgi:cytochrome d ubiquinol oxidase subunit II
MTHEGLAELAAGVALIGLMAYALLGGGVWDLFASGPRRRAQREAIARAMGPIWEANHVWLIFVLVVLFTCFPYGYAPLGIALFIPFHLALAGIMLRGAAFVFRGHGRSARETTGTPAGDLAASRWGLVFGIASLISPVLLGLAFGVVTEGGVRIDEAGNVGSRSFPFWLSPYAFPDRRAPRLAAGRL